MTLNSDRKIRLGFIGAGRMGQAAHLRNYVTIPDCEVVALAEIRVETGRLVAQRFGIPNVYRTHTEMLDAESLDGIVAIQPFDTHATLLPDVYGRAGFLFTEKPLAVSVRAAEGLVEHASSSGTVHMVGYHKRSDPATTYAKQVISEWTSTGHMGSMRFVRVTMPSGDWIAGGMREVLGGGDEPTEAVFREPAGLTDLPGADANEVGWRWSGPAGAYFRFVNYYIHQVNYLRHMLGEPYRVTFADRSGVLLAVESASGVTGTLEMSPYNTTLDWEESILVGFEKGCIRIDLPAPLASNRPGRVEVLSDPGGGVVPERRGPSLPWVHAMRQQAINFVCVCRGEMEPPCAAPEALEDLRIARDYIRAWKSF